MHARAILLTALTTASLAPGLALGQIRSVANQWVDRYLPESGDKLDLPSYADATDRARAEIRVGRYRAALSTLQSAGTDPRTDVLTFKSLAALGEISAAMEITTRPGVADAPELLEPLFSMHMRNGTDGNNVGLVARWLEKTPDAPLPHLLHGQLLEFQGKYDEAIAAYKWFVEGQQVYLQKWSTDPEQFENADDLTAIATAIDRWATLTRAYPDLPQLNNTVLNMFVRAFDVIDRDHLPSRLAAARFALGHGDTGGAMKHLSAAWKAAPLNTDVLEVVGEIMSAQGNSGEMQNVVELLRGNDPESSAAGVFEVLMLLRRQQYVPAGDRAIELYKHSPARVEAIGLRGATAYLLGDEVELPSALKDAETLRPKSTDAHLLAASVLQTAWQHKAAEPLYKTVIERTPWVTEARHGLGDMYLNDGREDEARVVLDEAYKADPYNVSTVNYLRLLDETAKYAKLESDHFIFYFDQRADPIVFDEIGPYLESCWVDVTKTFGFEPKQKVIVQVFPNDDEFSVRMAGVPGIENYGVSFGRVLATIAPRKGTKQGNFNWARVLKHEFVHTINILQTNNRCPRWLTEGMAVWQENVPFRFANVPAELYKRTFEGTLFRIRNFPLAFIAPKHPLDGEQAYTQGAYLTKYLVATYGPDSVRKLLNGYATSKSDEDAFRQATGQSLETIEDGWHAWMKVQLKSWNYDEASTKTVASLMKEGEQYIKAKELGAALKSWQAANDLQPTEVKPHQRLAYIYLQKDFQDLPRAIEHLKFLHVLELQNNRYAKQISRLFVREGDLENAFAWAKEATYVDLYDPAAHALIAEISDKLNRPADAERARQTVAKIEVWEATRGKPKPISEPVGN